MRRQLPSSRRRLNDDDRAVWRAFVVASPRIVSALDADLKRAFGISVASLEVLYQLAAVPGKQLRMAELADQLVYTRSGITRLVERLERDGLLERQAAPDDARGIYAALTTRGMQLLDEALDHHIADVRRLFLDRIREDKATLLRILRQLEPD